MDVLPLIVWCSVSPIFISVFPLYILRWPWSSNVNSDIIIIIHPSIIYYWFLSVLELVDNIGDLDRDVFKRKVKRGAPSAASHSLVCHSCTLALDQRLNRLNYLHSFSIGDGPLPQTASWGIGLQRLRVGACHSPRSVWWSRRPICQVPQALVRGLECREGKDMAYDAATERRVTGMLLMGEWDHAWWCLHQCSQVSLPNLKVKNSLGLVGDVTLHAALEYAKIVSIFPYLPLRDALADLCLQYKSVRVL